MDAAAVGAETETELLATAAALSVRLSIGKNTRASNFILRDEWTEQAARRMQQTRKRSALRRDSKVKGEEKRSTLSIRQDNCVKCEHGKDRSRCIAQPRPRSKFCLQRARSRASWVECCMRRGVLSSADSDCCIRIDSMHLLDSRLHCELVSQTDAQEASE